jgi:predicted nuclease of predicted toxin-antitoxin system
MRVLFDQNIPRSLRQFLPGYDIRTAVEMGWSALSNGLILDAAEAAGFHVMITADRNMRH